MVQVSSWNVQLSIYRSSTLVSSALFFKWGILTVSHRIFVKARWEKLPPPLAVRRYASPQEDRFFYLLNMKFYASFQWEPTCGYGFQGFLSLGYSLYHFIFYPSKPTPTRNSLQLETIDFTRSCILKSRVIRMTVMALCKSLRNSK
jgi:hypothetical protein